MSEELKACALCGKPDVTLENPSQFQFWVECKACGAMGPNHRLPEKAISAWNTRAESPEQAHAEKVAAAWKRRAEAIEDLQGCETCSGPCRGCPTSKEDVESRSVLKTLGEI